MIEKETVLGWLQAGGLEAGDVDLEVPEGAPPPHWSLTFKGPRFTTLAYHLPVEHNHIVMQVGISISDEHRALFQAVGADTRDRFIHDLRIKFLQAPVGYELEFDDEDPPILERMVFGYNLFEDPIQMAGFFRRNHQLQSTALLGVEMIRKLARFEEW